ncbi:penicillin-binding protein [Brachybacterium endophyticum]|uniref:Penicillin-binding protein n=1 Tax=Brachybacterium endophyticum TaxID=2182385 RepID=A0A2U2RP14_9MICO|nr:serine hydrolase domain-containing protein [Brachybacterium endophyticum]PWH07607.1 penicillin-binding protein [Brachybacterium endophyticum]
MTSDETRDEPRDTVDELLEAFGFPCALGVTDAQGPLLRRGETSRVHPLASVSKPVTALGALIALDRSLLSLDQEAGPEGATVRHLLAHTAGYAFDADTVLAAPGTRRIYSNTGFEVLGRVLEDATGSDLPDWLEGSVVQGLGLVDLEVDGSPAAGFRGSIEDLLALGRELLHPTLIGEELWREATTVQFPGLAGVVPGFGRQRDNTWGLGLEIRDHKSPHWTGELSGPTSFGHFGQSGSFLLVDPDRGLSVSFLGEEPFGPVHQQRWPGLLDAVLERADAGTLGGDGARG